MYIVADIGGTKTRVAASVDGATFGEPVMMDTPLRYGDGVAAFITHARGLSNGQKIDGIAIGIKGVVAADKRSVITAPQNILLDWKDRPLAQDIEAQLGASVRMENDTALVGLGEAAFGAGKDHSVVAYLTVSTGVNGVRIVDGAIDRGRAEIGGQYLRAGDTLKSIEDHISGAAISDRYGVHPKEIDKDSPLWEELARITAFGVHNMLLHWSPDIVVLGGSMFNEIGIAVPRVEYHVKNIMRKFPTIPPMVHSVLGEVGGLWGGLALLGRLAR